jgi:SlyX protein
LNERIQRLEEKIAYLERHVTEQDRAMLELIERIEALRRELKTIREHEVRGRGSEKDDNQDLSDERPPHY